MKNKINDTITFSLTMTYLFLFPLFLFFYFDYRINQNNQKNLNYISDLTTKFNDLNEKIESLQSKNIDSIKRVNSLGNYFNLEYFPYTNSFSTSTNCYKR